MKGFTLIELVLAIAIMAILSFFAVTRLNPDQGLRDVFYFHNMLSKMRYAHDMAVSGQCDVKVNIDLVDSVAVFTMTTRQTDRCESTEPFSISVDYPDEEKMDITPETATSWNVSVGKAAFYFDGIGRARDIDTNETFTQSVLTVSGKNIIIVGETGFIYEE
jgi:prepilin-type N-terminal cleavage/methylation domain-containing protein